MTRTKSVLEVGTGSGFIASYFSHLGFGPRNTYAVDVVDERQVKEDFQFRLVEDVVLPFSDNSFNFVVSNHVIEHVGAKEKQLQHLDEIYRVLEPEGVFYFAVPNRWRIIEPYYKFPLLSWMPSWLFSSILRLTKKGDKYDCRPLSHNEATNMLTQTGFTVDDVTLKAVEVTIAIEDNKFFTRQLKYVPSVLWKIFMPIMPTLIFVCRRPINEKE